MVFTTNDGSSAGKVGPFVGKVEQAIDLSSKEYTNFVKLGGGIVVGALGKDDIFSSNHFVCCMLNHSFQTLSGRIKESLCGK